MPGRALVILLIPHAKASPPSRLHWPSLLVLLSRGSGGQRISLDMVSPGLDVYVSVTMDERLETHGPNGPSSNVRCRINSTRSPVAFRGRTQGSIPDWERASGRVPRDSGLSGTLDDVSVSSSFRVSRALRSCLEITVSRCPGPGDQPCRSKVTISFPSFRSSFLTLCLSPCSRYPHRLHCTRIGSPTDTSILHCTRTSNQTNTVTPRFFEPAEWCLAG